MRLNSPRNEDRRVRTPPPLPRVLALLAGRSPAGSPAPVTLCGDTSRSRPDPCPPWGEGVGYRPQTRHRYHAGRQADNGHAPSYLSILLRSHTRYHHRQLGAACNLLKRMIITENTFIITIVIDHDRPGHTIGRVQINIEATAVPTTTG